MKLSRITAIVALAATILASCSTPKQTTIEGYSGANLNRKRVAVLFPKSGDYAFTNAEQFGNSRGVAAVSAGETLDNELRTVLVAALQARLDSNTVLNYQEMPVSGIVPLSATTDFNATGATSWDNVKRAGQEGAIDYLLVIRDVKVTSTASSDPRGNETVTATYLLTDPRKQSVMTSGSVSVDVSAPRTVEMTHERLAVELTSKMPFTVVE